MSRRFPSMCSRAAACSDTSLEPLKMACGIISKLPVRDDPHLADGEAPVVRIHVREGPVQHRLTIHDYQVLLAITAEPNLRRATMGHAPGDVRPDGVEDVLEPV